MSLQRPLGLAGVWGALVRAWLDGLLPEDAHLRCAGRVKLVVTEVSRSTHSPAVGSTTSEVLSREPPQMVPYNTPQPMVGTVWAAI